MVEAERRKASPPPPWYLRIWGEIKKPGLAATLAAAMAIGTYTGGCHFVAAAQALSTHIQTDERQHQEEDSRSERILALIEALARDQRQLSKDQAVTTQALTDVTREVTRLTHLVDAQHDRRTR
jgi:hypothetical protein